MATKQGMGNQLLGFFIAVVTFLLAYGTIHVASEKALPINQTSLDLFRSDPACPWYGQELPPEPYPRFYIYIKNCLVGLGDKKCVQQIFDEMFDRNQVEVSCCCKVKQIGHMCMMGVAGTTGHMNKFKAQAQRIYGNTQKIIDRCDKLTNCPKTN